MRKMKKINGYLVVRFNDREKREHEGTGLGSFGVIDAELYTGVLDVDRSVMEYDDAETLEAALEQARSLESELDVEEPEVKITVIIEGETEVSEEEVVPEQLFKERRTMLEAQLQREPDPDPLAAAHELHGYVRALEDLGMIDGHDERFLVERDAFGVAAPPLGQQEEALAYICDEVCKYREGRTQEELDAICANCKVDRWAGDPPQENFRHLPKPADTALARKAYRLGLSLEAGCPENDCTTYLRIYRMARELDEALERMEGYAAEVLQRELGKHMRDLKRMYYENQAVKQFREGVSA